MSHKYPLVQFFTNLGRILLLICGSATLIALCFGTIMWFYDEIHTHHLSRKAKRLKIQTQMEAKIASTCPPAYGGISKVFVGDHF